MGKAPAQTSTSNPDYTGTTTQVATSTSKAIQTTTTDTVNSKKRTINIPEIVNGKFNDDSITLSPQNNWFAYQGQENVIDDKGRYIVVVGPKVLDPNYSDEGAISAEDFNYPVTMSAYLKNKTTCESKVIECVTYGSAKAHTYNTYNTYDCYVSFDIESGLLQTGIAYPNSWNAIYETPFSEANMDGSSIEFVGTGLDFNPNDYLLEKIDVYN